MRIGFDSNECSEFLNMEHKIAKYVNNLHGNQLDIDLALGDITICRSAEMKAQSEFNSQTSMVC